MYLLFDLDGFVYRAAFSAQKTVRFVSLEEGGDVVASFDYAKDMNAWLEERELKKDDVFITTEIKTEEDYVAKHNAKAIVHSVQDRFPGAISEYYLSGKGNFRDLIYSQYKANRKAPKPVYYETVKEGYMRNLQPIIVDGMEADDALAIRATELSNEGKEWCIVSQDKDLRTVPGVHFDPVKETVEIVDPWTADFNFYCQVLTGDTSDNIPGIYGLGKAKAKRILEFCDDEREMYETCVDVYNEQKWEIGKPIEVMHRNCQLLYMLRKRGVMWQPPM